MVHIEENVREKVKSLLRELFQFNNQDLDFGIYRIMNFKRKEIEKFIEQDLIAEAERQFQEYSHAGQADLKSEVDRLRAEIVRDFGEGTLDNEGNVKKNEDAPKIKLYLEKKKLLEQAKLTESQVSDVFNHIYEFFSRYYDKGDFIPKRRYGGKNKYYIPYNGEEVALYWATKDMYYVKTDEFFKKYSFRTGRYLVTFVLTGAKVEVGNVKGEKKYFLLAPENPVTVDDSAGLVEIRFNYHGLTEEEASKLGKQDVQGSLVNEAIEKIASLLEKSPVAGILKPRAEGEKPLLQKHLNSYVERNTRDFFIHKNLKGFLESELEFYLKNEVWNLSELEAANENTAKLLAAKAKAIHNIAIKIIDFLSQIEDFQKMLFEKKKLVIATEYIITLDKIAKYTSNEFMDKITAQILSNNEMLKEWTDLLSVTIKSKRDLIEATIKGNEWKKLPLDTKYFSENFKFQLLEEISKNNFLDQLIDGLLIKSENWQALNLIQEKYRETIRCVYIDPPFNSKTSEILYKNNFKHSSWLSLMENRISKSKDLLCEDACYVVAIDENEQERVGILLSQLFPNKQKTCVSIIHNPGGIQGDNFSYCHEYAYFLYPETGRYISLQNREDNPDIRPLRNVSKGDHLRETAANCFYPIIIKDGKIVEFGDVSDDSFHPKSANIVRPDGSIEVYPIDPQGNERKWVFARQSVETIRNELSVKYNKQRGIWDVIRKKTAFNYKTVWTDKLYNANIYGSKLLNDILAEERFSFPKSLYNIADCIFAVTGDQPNALILDYFGGSGTTAHAVMTLNEKDAGSRKFIIVEMADYFYSVLLPRIKKICYSKEWRNGKPVDNRGFSGFFKYHELEQFEDTLTNVSFVDKDKRVQETLDRFEDYFLRYMLDYETRESPTRLMVERFVKPFDYKIRTISNTGEKTVTVDLVETFNYLLGLTVEKLQRFVDNERIYRVVFGKLDNQSVCVVWRDLDQLDLERDKQFIEGNILAGKSFDFIYVNGDSYVKNARPIEPEFKKLMGA